MFSFSSKFAVGTVVLVAEDNVIVQNLVRLLPEGDEYFILTGKFVSRPGPRLACGPLGLSVAPKSLPGSQTHRPREKDAHPHRSRKPGVPKSRYPASL